jgi:hypothetical protein
MHDTVFAGQSAKLQKSMNIWFSIIHVVLFIGDSHLKKAMIINKWTIQKQKQLW